jgi:membrane protein implicated in regulation of membrane protease activity
MGFYSYVIIGILILLTLLSLGYAAYLKFSRKYARERFAFAALGATVCISVLMITSVGMVSPWTAVIQLAGMILDKPLETPLVPPWQERLLVVVFALIVIYFIWLAFREWHGPISERQHRQSRFYESPNLVVEGVEELGRIIARRPPPKIYVKPEFGPHHTALEAAPTANLVWRDHARELVELKFRRYRFDEDEDWHERASCWIGYDTKTQDAVAVHCAHEYPTHEALVEFVEYANRVAPKEVEVEFFIVTRDESERGAETVLDRRLVHETETSLLDDLVDFSDYIADIRKRVERESLPDSDLKIADIYVESSLKDENGALLADTLETYLLN